MSYLLDTVALIRHFTGEGKIGAAASRILDGVEETDTILVVSAVSLMEVLYLAEKHRISIDLAATLRIMGASSQYMVVDLNAEILTVAESVAFPELHDRLILASAKWLGIPIISSDRDFMDDFPPRTARNTRSGSRVSSSSAMCFARCIGFHLLAGSESSA